MAAHGHDGSADPTTSNGILTGQELLSETEEVVRRLSALTLTFRAVQQLDGSVQLVCLLPGFGLIAQIFQRVHDQYEQDALHPELFP